MTRAYREYYLEDAMEVLGAMLEDAVMLFDIPLDRFWALFLASPISARFAAARVSRGMSLRRFPAFRPV